MARRVEAGTARRERQGGEDGNGKACRSINQLVAGGVWRVGEVWGSGRGKARMAGVAGAR